MEQDEKKPDSEKIAFSFKTTADDSKVYLIPTSDSKMQIETKVTDDAPYVFNLGPIIKSSAIEATVNKIT